MPSRWSRPAWLGWSRWCCWALALLLAGLVMAAWIEEFQYVGVGMLVALAVLGRLIFAVDPVAGLKLGRAALVPPPRAAFRRWRSALGPFFRAAGAVARSDGRRGAWRNGASRTFVRGGTRLAWGATLGLGCCVAATWGWRSR
ncbi:MAG: hypothetical protein IPM40_12915 [Gammaproteobacteria bacterium]|nr:hypothetical protein [Gammaproteobacteria bacterium]